eukprot:scaffold238_cov532-Prasinococcus_capsulatus_cf.AAC.8
MPCEPRRALNSIAPLPHAGLCTAVALVKLASSGRTNPTGDVLQSGRQCTSYSLSCLAMHVV